MIRAWTLMISILLPVGCGIQDAERKSIDNDNSASAVAALEGTPFHSLTGWKQAVGFYVEASAPDAVVEGAIQSAESWNDAVGRDVLAFAGVAEVTRNTGLYSSLDDALTIVFVEKKWGETTGKSLLTLATTVWENARDSDQIVKGDIILNSETYHFCDALAAIDPAISTESVVDAETVLLHEFGHLLGLDHVSYESDPESVMHARTYIGPNLSFRQPSTNDINNMQSIYDLD